MIADLRIPSPKRTSRAESGWAGFFPYYAGFPEGFARALLESAQLSRDSVVLDPWNGSGTTTYVASRLGLTSCGFDINPVMVIVARARLLATSEADSIEPLALEVIKSARTARDMDEDDPLGKWFAPSTAGHIRGLERSIRRHLIGSRTISTDGTHLDQISGLAATFYVALFSVCRTFVARFQSSNPTWLRQPEGDERRVHATRRLIVDRLKNSLSAMAAALAATDGQPGAQRVEQGNWSVRLIDTSAAVLNPGSADFILTSPPYCTRIDYTAATRIELALLAPLLQKPPKELARQMMGSICVPKHDIEPSVEWGHTCNNFLVAMRGHSSKASHGYYYKTHLDYFEKLYKSLKQLVLALKNNGVAILVVQNSYYKELHNDLPKIVCEMAGRVGLGIFHTEEFRLRRSMAGLNPHSRTYHRPEGVTEAVLCFRKH